MNSLNAVENNGIDLIQRIESCKSREELSAIFAGLVERGREFFVLAGKCAIKARQEKWELEIPPVTLALFERIGQGSISPGLVVACQMYPKLLDHTAMLPMEEQEQIADGKPLKVMLPDGDHRMVPAQELSKKEIAQVFHRGTIRSDAAQLKFLREKLPVRKSRAADDTFSVDRHKKTISFHADTTLSFKQLSMIILQSQE